MAGLSTDFLEQLRGPWEMAQAALIDQFSSLQAQLSPIFPLITGLQTGTANSIINGGTGYSTSSVLSTDSSGATQFANVIPCPLGFATGAIVSPSALTGNTNDYAPASLTSAAVLRISAGGAYNLTGLTADTKHRMKLLVNIGAVNTITLTHADAASTAANRWRCPGAANFALTADKAVWIYYDLLSAVWQVVG